MVCAPLTYKKNNSKDCDKRANINNHKNNNIVILLVIINILGDITSFSHTFNRKFGPKKI